jgi:hypothetical protein
MCFSAQASFTLSGILIGVGVASMARSASPAHRMLAAAPVLFGVQQAAEGVVWLTIGAPARADTLRLAVDIFLGLALVVWPVWVPLALRQIERHQARRRILTGLCWLSALISVSAAGLLSRWQPFATIVGNSVAYSYPGTSNTALHLLLVAAYIVSTIGPFFVSTSKLARTLGITLIVSVVAAAVIRRDSLTSVWCFFAAALSVLIFFAVADAKTGGALERSSQ